MDDFKIETDCYEEVELLNAEHKVSVVRHRETGRTYLKKIMPVYNRAVFEQLKSHPVKNTPQIYALSEDAETQTLTVIEEYIKGSTLQDILDQRGPLPEEDIVTYGIRLCSILHDLHHADPMIIHRDIKPSNVIIGDDGELTLIDFNAAKHFDPGQNRDTTLLGTEGFAAPEQFGFGASTPQTDLYALGVLMAVLLTGENSLKDLPDGKLSEIIRKCTKLDPADRYQSALQLKAVLEKINTPLRKKRLLLVPAALLVIAAVAVLLLLRKPEEEAVAVDKNVAMEETSPIEDTAGVDESATLEEVATTEDTTAVEETNVVEDAPASEEAATIEETPEIEDTATEDENMNDPVGVYIGDGANVLVLADDGTANYYCEDSTFTDLRCPYTYTGKTLSIEMAKLHCTVQAKIKANDFSEFVLRSDSANWNEESFRKIKAAPEVYLKRTVTTYNPDVTVNTDGTMNYSIDGLDVTIPKYYCVFNDEGYGSILNYTAFENINVDHYYASTLVFYTEKNASIVETFFKDPDQAVGSFCGVFFENAKAGKATKTDIAGRTSYICDVSGHFNSGFGGLSGLTSNGKLAAIPGKQSDSVIYILFVQTENNTLDYSKDFDKIIEELK